MESITFEGNRRYSTENLKYSMRTKEGRTLDRELLARDQAALYVYFESVSLREEAVPGGVRLIFTVVENPVVSRVDFVGVRNLKEDDLRTLLDTRTGYPLASFKLENDVNRIVKRYRDEGYHWIDVKAETPEDEGARRVIFRVVEGPRVRVREILFEGNASIPDKKLLPVMALRPGWWRLLSPTDFVERRLDEDRVALARYYHDQGFLDARVWMRPVTFNGDRDLATITVVVEEGEAWTVGEVQVAGGAALTDRAKVVEASARLVPGQRWLRKDVDRVVKDMETEAKRQGFSDCHVEIEAVPRATGLVQDVRFAVYEGKRFTIRFLDVSGNVVTRDKVIIREFTVGPGDPLDSAAIAKSIRRVTDTQFFSYAAPVYKEVPDDPDRKDVEIRVEEAPKTSSAQFQVGISSDKGLSATIAVTLRNFDIEDAHPLLFFEGRGFKGAGQTLGVTLSPGTVFSNYDINFFEPWFLDRRFGVGGDLYIWRSTRFEYNENHKGGLLRGVKSWLLPGEDLDDAFAVELDPRAESVEISHIDVHAPPNAFALEGINAVHSLALKGVWRRLDQEHATERGWSATVGSEYGGGPLGGDFDYWKNDAELTRVFTLWRDADERAYTLKLRGGLGVGMATGEGKVPLVERYFAGGATGIGAVRGYAYYGLGPHGQGDPSKGPFKVYRTIENNFGQPMGGDAVSSGTVEFDYPVFSDVIGGALFLDGGNCGFSTGDLKRDWRAAWGFGILIRIPFFGQVPLRFDFGFPFKTVRGDKRQMLSFGLNLFFF